MTRLEKEKVYIGKKILRRGGGLRFGEGLVRKG